MQTITLFDPTAPRREAKVATAKPRLASLHGITVGFIDNAKPNFEHLVDDLAEMLVSNYGVAKVIKRRKRSASVPAPEETLAEVVRDCDLIITGSGD
jgi:hypothetical protein